MSAYRPVRVWADLPGGNPVAAAESYALDYKARHNSDGSEHAKDIAAFANALGGCILVGVAEKSDSFTRSLLTVADARVAARDYEDAARSLLSPRPMVDICVVRSPDDDSRALLAVNVEPFPGQLVGAKLPQTDAWRFPVRTATRHSAYLDPERLMIYSDPRTRKAAILLSSIDPTVRTVTVQVMERREGPDSFSNRDALYEGELKAVDVQRNSVSLELRLPNQIMPIAVPLEDVEAVWTGGGMWTIRLDGAIRYQNIGRKSQSIWYISGRGPYEWR